jgi:DNA-binding MarR family transcriptional regulator
LSLLYRFAEEPGDARSFGTEKREPEVDGNQAAEASVDLEFIVQGAKAGQKLELRLWLRMLSTTKLISQEVRRRLRAEFNRTLPQFDLLAQLFREPDGLRLGELSKRTMVTNGNVTGLVDRLVAEGLIARETLGGDRRVTVAKLTRRGSAVFAEMAEAHEGWLRDMMGEVDVATRRTLLDHLAALKASVGNHVAETGHD